MMSSWIPLDSLAPALGGSKDPWTLRARPFSSQTSNRFGRRVNGHGRLSFHPYLTQISLRSTLCHADCRPWSGMGFRFRWLAEWSGAVSS